MGVLSLGGFFMYSIYSLDSETASLIAEAQDLSKKSQQLASVRTVLRESSALLEDIDDIFVAEDFVSSFIDSLESLATTYNVTISIGSINIEPIPNMTETKQLRIRVSGSGNWEDVVSFSASLESLPRAVSIQTFSLSKDTASKGESEPVRWNTALDISTLIRSH